jgi:hypothetical protein
LLASLLVASFGLLTSCGGGDRFELTLRARDANAMSFANCPGGLVNVTPGASLPSDVYRCEDTFEERRWVTSDGGRAITPAHIEVRFVSDVVALTDVVCGGKGLGSLSGWESGPGLTAFDASFELRIDDGNTLMLDQQTGVWVDWVDVVECFETAGRWRGTAGQVRGRTGSFTIRYDSIQTVIKLVED